MSPVCIRILRRQRAAIFRSQTRKGVTVLYQPSADNQPSEEDAPDDISAFDDLLLELPSTAYQPLRSALETIKRVLGDNEVAYRLPLADVIDRVYREGERRQLPAYVIVANTGKDDDSVARLDTYAEAIVARMRRLPNEKFLTVQERQTFADHNKRLQTLANLYTTKATLGRNEMRQAAEWLTIVMRRERVVLDETLLPLLTVKVFLLVSTNPIVELSES